MLEIQLCFTIINYILKYFQIENSLIYIVILFHNITGFTLLYFVLYQINTALVRIRDFFKKDITDSKLLNSSVCAAGRAAGQVDYQQRALRSLLQYTTEYC